MTSNNPRRTSSRGATPRPRKIAGQDRTTADEPVEPTRATEPVRATRPAAKSRSVATSRPEPTPADPEATQESSESPRLGTGEVTRKLIVAVAVLAVILVAQGVWFFVHHQRNDEPTASAADGSISVPDGRPILISESEAQDAAQAASDALNTIVARNFGSYDADVEKATATMTESFAASYRETTDQIKDEFVANRTTVQTRTVAQGVVRANSTQVEVLVFLNQYVTKGPKKDQTTSYTPYRALVTMVSTERGWLVDALDTK